LRTLLGWLHFFVCIALNQTPYHYCIIRKDLPLGVLAAQLVHAAGESAGVVPANTHAVVLSVPNEASLLQLEQALISQKILHSAIRERDPPWNGALMAIGLPPQPKTNIKRLLQKLPLLR
jgi:peptidyl-tRNA hydrolase